MATQVRGERRVSESLGRPAEMPVVTPAMKVWITGLLRQYEPVEMQRLEREAERATWR